MAKRSRDQERTEPQRPEPTGSSSSGMLTVALLAGVGITAFLGAMTWSQNRKIQTTLDERLVQIQSTVAALSAKVDAGARAAAQPRQQGPDPNRAYTIRTAGAPAEGPESAAVTIAEFSDFQ
jgi:hypothetical protein